MMVMTLITVMMMLMLQEEYELTQRKFMRHIINFVSSSDSVPMPRLLIVDFDKQGTYYGLLNDLSFNITFINRDVFVYLHDMRCMEWR